MNSTKFQLRSLKTRVTLSTLVIFVTCIWSLSFYASRMLHKDIGRLLGDQQSSTAAIVATSINEGLNDRLRALEIAAIRFSPVIPGSRTTLQTLLEDRTVTQSLFNGGTFITRIDGTAVAEVPLSAGRTGLNFVDRDYIAGPLKEGKVRIGRPEMDRNLLSPAITMAVPIRDRQGRVIGALAGVTRLDTPNFLDKILGNRYGKNGYYLLEERKGRMIITGTGKSRIMQPLPAPGINPLIDRHVQGHDETGTTVNPLGVEVLASARRIPETDWFIVAALPTSEAFAPIHGMRQRILQATIVLTLLAGGLTWWILRLQLSPLHSAAQTLASMSGTNQPAQPLPITSQDEIGSLIGGFNRLLETSNQREALLKQILDTSSVAIFLVDMEGRITRANQCMAEMFRCSLDELERKEYVALVHPEECEVSRQKMLALLASAVDSVDLDRLYRRCDNSEFWGHLTGRRFFDASGENIGLVGVIADVNERKQAEDLVIESNERLLTILNSLDSIVYVADMDTHELLFVNKTVRDVFGDIAGQTCWKAIQSGQSGQCAFCSNDKLLDETGNPSGIYRWEFQNTVNGHWYDVRDRAIKWMDGRIVRMEIASDITERKQAEEELQKKNAEIEQFIYTVSHDLRSPLVTVKTFMGYLEKDMTEGNQEQLIQDIHFIHNAADKMKLLLDELLEMSRIGRVETPPVRVSYKEIVAEVLESLAGSISERKVDIHPPDTDLVLFGDRQRLCQVWQNLVENAIKYSSASSIPRIELGIRQTGEETVFSVRDYGIGIDDQYATKIFGIFEKLDPKSSGAGLGLSMVQRIVEKYGGRVWVESEGHSKGSCFFFTLPHAGVQG